MNINDQRAREIRIAAALILAWGLVQFAMFFPNVTYTPNADGHGGTYHLNAVTGVLNILCGVGILRWSRPARFVGLLFARLRVVGCLLSLLEWSGIGFSQGHGVLDALPLTVQKMVFVPFLLAQAYIIRVLTRDDVIARFATRRPPPLPAPTVAVGSQTEL